ncbi:MULTISPECIES: hypothetical protein [Enterobacteriaceae]|uniref:Uncharacterized protein n=1 Tax=Citrobacter bitternis TaxID=1585982 RepID=A0ABW1Q0H7_9ENTR|nr:hypothetical protein [Phytobacter diazotrophicus]MDV2874485.1 hypothetical protein [Phytobacter diazotrophicus]
MKYPYLEEISSPAKLVSTINVSSAINAVICSGKATYLDLQERLSVRDMYNLLEIISVDNFNQRVWREHLERK